MGEGRPDTGRAWHDEMSEVTSALLAGAIVLALVLHLAWAGARQPQQGAVALAVEQANIRTVIADAAMSRRHRRCPHLGRILEWPARPDTHHRRHAGDEKTSGALAKRLDHRKGGGARHVRHDDAAGSPTTFSNFDHLDHTLPKSRIAGRGRGATDRKGVRFPQEIIADHLGIFSEGRAKELLITPNGVRIVWLLAEAERARYGVFRQAEFGDATLDPALIERLLESASTLRDAINRNERQAA